MADDFKTSFIDYLKERTSTPLWANFLFSWCICNWYFLVWLLYSKEGNPGLLIMQIKGHDFSFWYPVGIAVVLTIAIPFVNTGVFYFIELAKILRIKIRKNFSDQRWFSSIEYFRKVNEVRQLNDEKEKLDERIRINNGLQDQLSEEKSAKMEALAKFQAMVDQAAINKKEIEEYKSNIKSISEERQNKEIEKSAKIKDLRDSLFFGQTEFFKLLEKRDPNDLDFLPFMAGVWRNSWGINNDVELAEIKSDSGYYLEEVLAFQLESISYDSVNGKLSFIKKSKREGDKRELKNELIILNPSVMEGYEWNGRERYTISYQRQV